MANVTAFLTDWILSVVEMGQAFSNGLGWGFGARIGDLPRLV
jgi:hypothetical protein